MFKILALSTLVISMTVIAQDGEDNGIYLDQSYFDVSLPATYERCQDTQGMEHYLASLGAQDVDKLKNFNAFLIGCQALLQDRIAKNKEQVAKLEKEQKK